MQLFLLPFAGGNCYSYDFLQRVLPADIEAFALELPGRGKRHRESLPLTKKAAVDDYVAQVRQYRDGGPYLVYGHSMGATLGLSVVKVLEDAGDGPAAFIASGNPGPGVRETDGEPGQPAHLLDEAAFKAVLRKLGGLPEEVLENEDLYGFFGPIIRADFAILEEEASGEKDTRISAPVRAVMGTTEPMAERIGNWQHHTRGGFTGRLLEGNHFFIHHHAGEMANLIAHCASLAVIKY